MTIFSHSVVCCFALLMVSLALQKLFSFMRPYLLIVDLSARAMGMLFRKMSLVPICSKLFHTFSSFRFSMSDFILSSLTHLDLSFVQGDKYRFICILLHTDSQLNKHQLLKMISFFSLYDFGCFVKNQVSR